jgi:hypothetical protein
MDPSWALVVGARPWTDCNTGPRPERRGTGGLDKITLCRMPQLRPEQVCSRGVRRQLPRLPTQLVSFPPVARRACNSRILPTPALTALGNTRALEARRAVLRRHSITIFLWRGACTRRWIRHSPMEAVGRLGWASTKLGTFQARRSWHASGPKRGCGRVAAAPCFRLVSCREAQVRPVFGRPVSLD